MPVSAHCLAQNINDDDDVDEDDALEPAPAKASGGQHRNLPLRYDDCVMTSVSRAMVGEFIEANAIIHSGWRNPSTVNLLQAIYRLMLTHQTTGFGTFQDLLEQNNAHLVVAIVDEVKGPLFFTKITDSKSVFSGKVVPYKSIRMIASASANLAEPVIKLTHRRWRIARGKFTLPSGECVKGPYLVVAAIDNVSGFTLRARMLPVWFPEDHSTFSTVGSGYERMGMDAIRFLGGVAFTPVRESQLVQLQEAFGSRWRGMLPKYEFRPDMVLMPAPGGLITVVEIFGMTTFKPYAEGKTKKAMRIVIINLNGHVRCLCVPTKHVEKTMPPRKTIKMNLEMWYNNPENQLWRQASENIFPFLLNDEGCPFLAHDSDVLMMNKLLINSRKR